MYVMALGMSLWSLAGLASIDYSGWEGCPYMGSPSQLCGDGMCLVRYLGGSCMKMTLDVFFSVSRMTSVRFLFFQTFWE